MVLHLTRPRSSRVMGAASVLALALTPLGLTANAQGRPIVRAAGPATASVSGTGGELTYQASVGQVNKVVASVTWSDDKSRLVYQIDDAVQITIGNGCTYPIDNDHTSIRCEVEPADAPDPYATMAMNLRDRNDVVEFHNETKQVFFFSEFYLGAGKDTLDSSDAATGDGSFVWGQDGPDRLTTGSVATAQGGNGADTLTTSGNYSDLDGGRGNDKILAGIGGQFLRGGPGDDVIRGGGGKDTLYGGAGNDRLYGEMGADTLFGNSGDDRLSGGPGSDKLRGGAGINLLRP
jgi:serralysin